MSHSAAIGAGRNPRFGGGVAIVFPDFSVSSLWKPNSRDKQRKTKDFEGCGDVPCSRFFMSRPPLCPWGKKHAVFWDTKITLGLAPQTGSENRVARYVE